MVSGRSVCLGALILALVGAPRAAAEVPPYIQADPAAVTKAFGKQAADKIFSEAYTPVRQQVVLQSVKSIPGYDCPADPPITRSRGSLSDQTRYGVLDRALCGHVQAADTAQLPDDSR